MANRPEGEGLQLSRAELEQLCETVQPKRMAAWLTVRGWFFLAPARRGGIPKVLRQYAEACIANDGKPPAPGRTAEEWETMPQFMPPPKPPYEGSPLQSYHQNMRQAARARERDAARCKAEWEAAAPQRIAAARLARAALVRFHAGRRRVAKIKRTAPWADQAAIRAIYAEAQRLTAVTGVPHHVDHDYPLQGELVSGLHVETNLQILTGAENSRKKNHFEPC